MGGCVLVTTRKVQTKMPIGTSMRLTERELITQGVRALSIFQRSKGATPALPNPCPSVFIRGFRLRSLRRDRKILCASASLR